MRYSVNQWQWAMMKILLETPNNQMPKGRLFEEAGQLLASCTDDQLIDAEIRGAKFNKRR